MVTVGKNMRETRAGENLARRVSEANWEGARSDIIAKVETPIESISASKQSRVGGRKARSL